MSIADSVLNIGGDILQGRMNNANAKDAFQRQLNADDTQYQRSVADLKAAGLNPMLAYMSSPDPTPNAQVPQYQGLGSAGSDIASTNLAEAGASSARATAAKTSGSDTANTDAMTALAKANASLAAANTSLSSAKAGAVPSEVSLNNSSSAVNMERIKSIVQDILESKAKIPLYMAQGRSADAQAAKDQVTKSIYSALGPLVTKAATSVGNSAKSIDWTGLPSDVGSGADMLESWLSKWFPNTAKAFGGSK